MKYSPVKRHWTRKKTYEKSYEVQHLTQSQDLVMQEFLRTGLMTFSPKVPDRGSQPGILR